MLNRPPPAPPEKLQIESVGVPNVIIKRETPVVKTFYHSGDVGDILYSLMFIKSLGGGRLFIGPDRRWQTNSFHDRQRYHWMLSLLRAQPYLTGAFYTENKPLAVDYDLNLFREIWMTGAENRARLGLNRLFEAYPKRFGAPPVSEEEPWLTVAPIEHGSKPVVIHRSFRYHNPKFPWPEVAARYADRMLFVGLKTEWAEWCRAYGSVAEYRPTKDAMEMAQVVAGAKLFIGNQSSPNAMALGVGTPVIQEVCLSTPDCVMKRSNAQYFFWGDQISWPKIGRDFVSGKPNAAGKFEIGPCADATGLGDYLTVTPVARELGDRCVMKMPPANAEIAKLFAGLCEVQLTDEYPVFRHIGGKHSARSKLELFGIHASLLPTVVLTPEEIEWGKKEVEGHLKPIAFVPSCSRHWAHLRQKPPEYWVPILARIKRPILQFGREDYPLVRGAIRMPFYGLRQLAAVYAACGFYLGVDTGDSHLMLAVGGRVVVLHPGDAEGYSTTEWHYRDPRSAYVKFNAIDQLYGHLNGG